MYRLFSWRIASHVPPWDWEQIRSEVDTWEEWLPTWVRWAERHVALGDEALTLGRRLTAGEAYVRAGLFYHWGTFVSVEDSAAFRNALEAADRTWAKAAPLVEPPFELVDIPFEGTMLPGYLRKPPGAERPPLVVLLPGADSTKEELYGQAEHLLRRGLAAFPFAGPGHGLVSFRLKLRPDEEVAVSAVLDHLLTRGDLRSRSLARGFDSTWATIPPPSRTRSPSRATPSGCACRCCRSRADRIRRPRRARRSGPPQSWPVRTSSSSSTRGSTSPTTCPIGRARSQRTGSRSGSARLDGAAPPGAESTLGPMPRISYYPVDKLDDPELLGYLEHAARHGAPRPESQAIRAHVPAVLRSFSQNWQRTFRAGAVEHSLKELCRVYVSTTIDCHY